MAGFLQMAGDADSGFCTKPKCFIIPYTWAFIRFSHLYLEFHDHCIANDGRWEKQWVVDLLQGVCLCVCVCVCVRGRGGGRQRVGIILFLLVYFFSHFFCLFF